MSTVRTLLTNFSRYLRGVDVVDPAQFLYRSCKAHSRNQIWFTNARITDEFRSRHLLLMLNSWLVHRALILHPPKGLKIQECFFDNIWVSVEQELVEGLDVPIMSLNKRLKEVQGLSFTFCWEMDHALTLPTKEETVSILSGSLWKHLYNQTTNVPDNVILELALHVLSEQKRIAEIPFGELITGNVRWEPLPKFDGSLLLTQDKTKSLSAGKKEQQRPKKRFKKLYNNAAAVSQPSFQPSSSEPPLVK